MILRPVLFAGLFVCAVVAPAADGPDISRVRALGVEIEHALFDAEHGTPPSAAELARLQREMMALSQPGADDRTSGKLRAVGIAFQQLRHVMANKPSVSAPDPASFDRAVVTPTHGGACGNAIGLRADLPVRVTLGSAADAWFYADPHAGSGLRFVTRSNGPDPAIEVFAGCSPGSKPIAQNDDDIGLDASVAVGADASGLVYIHLSNTGEPGTIDLLSTDTVGIISGTVRDAKTAQPITSAMVNAYLSVQGIFTYSVGTYTDNSGNYTITPSQTGTFYVLASAQNHLPQVYPTGYCPYSGYYYYDVSSCDFSHAQTINVTATSNTTNINFSLSTGARLSGQVRDGGNIPMSGASVSLYSTQGYQFASVGTDAAGHFGFPTMPPGQYIVLATSNGYTSQYYDHVDCGGTLHTLCDFSTATAITVATADVGGIDFSLRQLSGFTGVVRINGQVVVADNNFFVSIMDAAGNQVGQAYYLNNAGRYFTTNVPPGTYYLAASGGTFYPQLYGGHDCQSTCSSEVLQGTPLTISSDGQQVEADFDVDPLPSLSGHITDSVTGDPVPNTTVYLSIAPNSSPYSYLNAVTDASGNYRLGSVPPGTYYVWAQSPDHVDQIYSGIPCELPNYYYIQTHCDVSGATLLTVANGQATVPAFDFSLSPAGSITGTASVRAGANSDLPALNVFINLFDNTGTLIGGSAVDAAGHYLLNDLAPGNYFIVASPSQYSEDYLSQMWQNKDCTTCVPTTSTPIVVAQGQTVANIDFHLSRPDAVVGRVTDADGDPIAGTVVDLFNASDKSYAFGIVADSEGYYAVTGLIGSSYFVATETGGGYHDQIYAGITCASGNAYDGRCAFTGATSITLVSGATQPHIVNFTLQTADLLFADGFE